MQFGILDKTYLKQQITTTYLLENAETGERSGDVQFNQLQTGFSVCCWKTSICQKTRSHHTSQRQVCAVTARFQTLRRIKQGRDVLQEHVGLITTWTYSNNSLQSSLRAKVWQYHLRLDHHQIFSRVWNQDLIWYYLLSTTVSGIKDK